ncbi:MAG TPA: bifunctional 4-hydroxy-2-oxoglutarate aldolase/2-dehydro-3-deoxy-phosphogluconate aldolase [Chitinophagaceae bacterium]|nr:bifunctional 4-hydroxy-2-oxoglutarate aldolase/2-dehydro-3-deoxy-phosphogluconate aldolase [Chitinophagaceae bacterium]
MSILQSIMQHKIVAIIRGADPEALPSIVEALQAGGIKAVEITLNSPKAIFLINKITQEYGNSMFVGAGTVLNVRAATEAIEAGARFIISPSVDLDTIRYCKEQQIACMPGAYTPTEIVTAFNAGADLIKIFPAPSPEYIKDLRGPLSHIPMMPTGGVTLQNIVAYAKAGAVAFGIGSALVNTNQPVTADYLAVLTSKAQDFVTAVGSIP